MDTAAASRQAAAATAVARAALGLAWHDCLPIALACVAGFRLLAGRLQGDASLDAWRASLRCITLGLLGMAAATALMVLTAGSLMGWWRVEHPQPSVVLAGLVIAGTLLASARTDGSGAWREAGTWAVLGVLMATALQLADAGHVAMPCLLVAGIGMHLAWNSWVIAHGMAGDLLRGGQRS
jgi:hypothetical protein